MKPRLRSIALAACLAWLLPLTSQAFYNPGTGRWLSRDPIEERGGRNLHGFVGNNPLGMVDRLGLEILCYYNANGIWTCRSPLEGCCNGRTYLYATHCCCKGKIVAKEPIATGIVTHKWKGTPGAGATPVHYWVTWDGGSADANSYSLLMQPGDGKVSSPAGATPSPSEPSPLKLSPCEYDFKKLNACMTRLADGLKASTAWWWCWELPTHMINTCMSESKGCTLLP